jgi:DNA-binding MarR family transcriptional regulator
MIKTLRQDEAEQFPPKVLKLSSADVAAAHRLIQILLGSSEADVVQIVPAHLTRTITREALIEAAWHELERRGRRMQLLPEGMFREAAWEMLLVLYAEQQRTRMTIAGLCNKLDLPGTTALRWLSYLHDKGLVVRDPHPTDQRSVFLRLTASAIEVLDLYLSEVITKAP